MADAPARPASDPSTTTPGEPAVTIPQLVEVSALPPLPGQPSGVGTKGNEVASASYAVATTKADQGFGKDFDKAKGKLVGAQGDFTAAKQAYALAVATYNSGLQQARATQSGAYTAADQAFTEATKPAQ